MVPAVVLLTETIAGLLPKRQEDEIGEAVTAKVVVLVPAHNEALQIAETVMALAQDLPKGGSVLVVADNCADETARLAASVGAMVIERHDLSRVGKGFAISFGVEHLSRSPPDVVVVVDADCRISPNGVAILAGRALERGRPIQAEYILELPENATPTVVVSGMAVLLRNRVRPRGLDRLGLSCSLTGSGMAFPWKVLLAAPETGAHLVEDLVMGIELALRGNAPEFCREVSVRSPLPDTSSATLQQRRRWEHGHLQTLLTHGPRLLVAGMARRELALVFLGLDLLIPPLSLLMLCELLWLGVTMLGHRLRLTSTVPVAIAAAALGQVALAVTLAWTAFGRRTIRWQQFAFVALYVVRKIPTYLAFFFRGRQKKWERTPRKGEPPP